MQRCVRYTTINTIITKTRGGTAFSFYAYRRTDNLIHNQLAEMNWLRLCPDYPPPPLPATCRPEQTAESKNDKQKVETKTATTAKTPSILDPSFNFKRFHGRVSSPLLKCLQRVIGGPVQFLVSVFGAGEDR